MANNEMHKILEDVNTTISDLSASFGENKKKTDSILMYLIQKTSALEEANKSYLEEIDSLKDEVQRLNTTICELEKSNSTTKDKVSQVAKKIDVDLNDMNNKISVVKSSTDEIMSHVLSADSFVVIDKNDPQFAKWNRMKRFFYLLLHYNKVKRIEKAKEEAAEQEIIRKKNEELKRKHQLELIEEEKKKEKIEQIKKILNSTKNKKQG